MQGLFYDDQSGTTVKLPRWGEVVRRTDGDVSDRSVEALAWYDLCETVSFRERAGLPRGQGPGAGESGLSRFVSAETLMNSLVRLELIEQAELDELLKRFPADLDPTNPEELARGLVRFKRLTEYQAGALLQGKSKGLVIDKYLILDKLGAGGMGMVFKALHRRIKRVVALKVLPPSFAKDETAVRRFHREAEAVAKVSHPNVVAVLDADEFNGLHFFAMEYSAGKDLKRLVEDRGPLPIAQAIECIVQAARGLGAAHARGIYHRDIKPSNLLLDPRGVLKVLDLGLARMDKGANLLGDAEPDPELTRPGIIMGTVAFMAPEQAYNSRSADHRSDIYSLGCTLFFLLTGRPPFQGDTLMARVIAHREEPIPSLHDSQPDLPLALDAVLRRMMAKAPQARYQSVDELIADLQSCQGLGSAAKVAWPPSKLVDASSLSDFGIGTKSLRPSRPWLLRRVAVLVLTISLASVLMVAVARMRVEPPAPSVAANPSQVGPRPEPAAKAILPEPPPALPSAIAPRAEPSPPPLVTQEETKAVPEPIEPIGEIRRFSGHEDRLVESIAVATDGKHALSAGLDCTVRYWNLATGDEIRRFVHDGPVFSVAFSHDNRLALTGGADKVMRLWDLEAGRELAPFTGFTQPIYSVALSPDGKYALSGSRDKSVRLWDVATRSEVYSLLLEGAVTVVAFSPDGERVLTGGEDKTVRVWKRLSPHEAFDFKSTAKVLCAAFSPDGHRALSGGDDGAIVLWNLDSKQIIRRCEGPRDQVRCVAFLPDSRHALSGTKAGRLILWNVEDDREVHRFDATAGRLGVAVLPDGRRALTSDDDGFVRLWKLPLVLE
ncbi:protein kinase domain-containing protein [Singulisphaera sp. GP187]|uniref:protein kinase domain-containing protein n=1 Tax=Singulisphaera sp. GP187 TaxID=1882752 RepID=UPI0020B120BB|nr:protein kinase [Singulisphaera sp. GP187]